MIDLYTWATPNGRKVSILLEELCIPYTVRPIDISKDEQFKPSFLKIAPNNRIPAIVDHETGIQLMETGAIMMYLAKKYMKFQCDGDEYWRMVEWLMWQMGALAQCSGKYIILLSIIKANLTMVKCALPTKVSACTVC